MDSEQTTRHCIFCSTENPATRRNCLVCANALISPEEIASAQDEFRSVDDPPDVSGLDLDCVFENGFSYPNWDALGRQVCVSFPEPEWWLVWHEISKRWLRRLKDDLGGNYRCYESEQFLLLGAEGSRAARTMLEYAENSRATIWDCCRPLLVQKTYGKHAILSFSEHDDYYSYISHFYPEGAHSLTAGVMLNPGYTHIALPFTWVFSTKRILTHELVHNCIAFLTVPTWVHEGLAQKLERLASGTGFILDREMAGKHHAYWTEETIQAFWSGRAFYGPDETNVLSYSMAEVMVELLSTDWASFLEFVRRADLRDAGQDAALAALGRCLGETVGGFLGPGNWRPQRKAIAEHHHSR